MKNDFLFSRVLRMAYSFIDVIMLAICNFLSFFVKKQKHWVLFERGTDARDNAYFFYIFLKEKHPEQKIYYIIKKRSADYDKVKNDAVYLGSFKNYWVVATAEKLISTHYGTGIPSYIRQVFKLFGLCNKFYFLQHGITQNDVGVLKYVNSPMQLFTCGAKPEYEYIKNNFGHPEGVVRYTGFARFDRLHDITIKEKQILVMPTWRYYIRSREQFLQSEYYKQWQELISNDELLQLLEQNDLTLVFYVHYEMQKYSDCFRSGSDRVIIAEFLKYDVQTLLKESALLVTDYSSVYFDFAYMKKPIVYYQFDEKQFYAHHYKKGYFDCREMGFGDVCNELEDLLDRLSHYSEKKMQVEPKYLSRIQDFFPLYDANNCERIFNAIAALPLKGKS